MRAALFFAALALLAACGKERDDGVEPVPQPTAESTNRLMGEAERAAGNAQQRINQTPVQPPEGGRK